MANRGENDEKETHRPDVLGNGQGQVLQWAEAFLMLGIDPANREALLFQFNQ